MFNSAGKLFTIEVNIFTIEGKLFTNAIYDCIFSIVTKLFTEFCNAVACKPKTKERDQNLETIAIILLIEFNNPNKNIRKHADRFLSCLVDRFPHLLWSKAVLFGMLNALQTLSLCVHDEDEQEVSNSFWALRENILLMWENFLLLGENFLLFGENF